MGGLHRIAFARKTAGRLTSSKIVWFIGPNQTYTLL
jgi:hypothetical protein